MIQVSFSLYAEAKEVSFGAHSFGEKVKISDTFGNQKIALKKNSGFYAGLKDNFKWGSEKIGLELFFGTGLANVGTLDEESFSFFNKGNTYWFTGFQPSVHFFPRTKGVRVSPHLIFLYSQTQYRGFNELFSIKQTENFSLAVGLETSLKLSQKIILIQKIQTDFSGHDGLWWFGISYLLPSKK